MFIDLLDIGHKFDFSPNGRYSVDCPEDSISELRAVFSENSSGGVIATACGCTLSITQCNRGVDNTLSFIEEHALEFDNRIGSICFDPSGICIIVSDIVGFLHFVTVSGSLIFSHKFSNKRKFSHCCIVGVPVNTM